MTRRLENCASRWLSVQVLVLALAAAGCTDTRETAEGQADLRGVSALGELAEVQFKVEEVVLGELDFRDISPFQPLDSLNYDFNFDYFNRVTDELERLASVTLTIVPDTDYTFVITGTRAAPSIIVIDQPTRIFDAAETVLEVWFGNLADQGAIDIYVGEIDFDPASSQPMTTLMPDEFSALMELETDRYQLAVTPAGDNTTILFRGEGVDLIAGDRVLVTVNETLGDNTGALTLQLAGREVNGPNVDDRAPSQVQVAHASFQTGAADVLVNADSANPIASNLSLGDLSSVVELAIADDAATFDLSVTSAGNPGAVLVEQADSQIADARTTLFVLSGDQADESLFLFPTAASRRRLDDTVLLSAFNALQNTDFIDLYILEDDQTINDVFPVVNDSVRSTPQAQSEFTPGDYNIVITDATDATVLYGPEPITLAPRDIVLLVPVDTADPNTASLLRFDLVP